jgi:Trypsin
MKMTLRLVAAAIAAAFISVTPAAAVVGGTPDTAHPYVGVVAFVDSVGHHLGLCSGFLTSETVFVTAGHCAGPLTPGAPGAAGAVPTLAFIWFGTGPVTLDPQTSDAIGVPMPSPSWNGVVGEHDVGYVRIVDSNIDLTSLGHATLAPAGTLEGIAKKRGQHDVSFTAVGYGAVDISPRGTIDPIVRASGTMQLEKLTDIDLLTTASPGNGTGGGAICKGDSGGPVFYGDLVVALVAGGTKYCNGKAADFRLDTVEAQSFIPTS